MKHIKPVITIMLIATILWQCGSHKQFVTNSNSGQQTTTGEQPRVYLEFLKEEPYDRAKVEAENKLKYQTQVRKDTLPADKVEVAGMAGVIKDVGRLKTKAMLDTLDKRKHYRGYQITRMAKSLPVNVYFPDGKTITLPNYPYMYIFPNTNTMLATGVPSYTLVESVTTPNADLLFFDLNGNLLQRYDSVYHAGNAATVEVNDSGYVALYASYETPERIKLLNAKGEILWSKQLENGWVCRRMWFSDDKTRLCCLTIKEVFHTYTEYDLSGKQIFQIKNFKEYRNLKPIGNNNFMAVNSIYEYPSGKYLFDIPTFPQYDHSWIAGYIPEHKVLVMFSSDLPRGHVLHLIDILNGKECYRTPLPYKAGDGKLEIISENEIVIKGIASKAYYNIKINR